MTYAHTHYSHCAFHLGDNIFHLHFLRAMAKNHPDSLFVHAVEPCHIPQLKEVVEDLENIQLIPLEERPGNSIDAWKNAGGFWERHPKRNDFTGFYLDFFQHKAAELGQISPFNNAGDLFFDYPALHRRLQELPVRFDFLVVNSQPCSGQLMAYDSTSYFDPLLAELSKKWHVVCTQPTSEPRVWCTKDFGLTISQIGHLSMGCTNHIMVATGPMWPTINRTNHFLNSGHRIALLGNGERLNISGITQMESLDEVMRHARSMEWI